MLLETGSRLQGIHLYDQLLKAEKVPVQMQEGREGRARYSKGPQWHGTSVTLYIDSTVHFCPPVTSVSSVLPDCICKV